MPRAKRRTERGARATASGVTSRASEGSAIPSRGMTNQSTTDAGQALAQSHLRPKPPPRTGRQGMS